MPGKHTGHPTIAFRPTTKWQYALIEERAKLSGMYKKDFITRACIYANICVVGKKENIQRIIDELEEMKLTLKEVAGQILTCNISLSEEGYDDFKKDFLVLCVTAVDIVNGAAYLFDKAPVKDNQHWKADLEVEQLKQAIYDEATL